MELDARGKNCPIPVIMAKKELDNNTQNLSILVDSQIQVDNLTRLGNTYNRKIESENKGTFFLVSFADSDDSSVSPVQESKDSCTSSQSGTNNYAVFLNSETIGQGSDELGQNLAKMALYTLAESSNPPAYMLLMNGAVKYATDLEPQTVEHLQALQKKGCDVLVCGTCLNYFNLQDQCITGTVSNMFAIIEAMQEVSKVITL